MGRVHRLHYLRFLGAAKQEKMPVKPLAPEVKRNAPQLRLSPEFLGDWEACFRHILQRQFWMGALLGSPATYQFQGLHGIKAGTGRPETV